MNVRLCRSRRECAVMSEPIPFPSSPKYVKNDAITLKSLRTIDSGQKRHHVKIILPWFRVHIVILNDPGRLISSHIMHTALVAGWSALMLLYELITIDPTDPVYNPIWRQAAYTLPFISRIGVIRSLFSWSLGIH